jgi:retron-type reverse transcriptase
VAQTAAKLVIEAIFEADLEPSAYGYRPKRSAQDAVQKVDELLHRVIRISSMRIRPNTSTPSHIPS